MKTCPECGGTADKVDGKDTLYNCRDCDATFMDNPQFNQRFPI